LQGEDRQLLALRPGITGPASLVFHDEEQILEQQEEPERYNHDVLWPSKVALNMHYLRHYSLGLDVVYILATLLPPMRRRLLASLPKVSADLAP